MKKYLIVATGFALMGISACEKQLEPVTSSKNSSTAYTAANNNNTNTPVPMDQAYWRVSLLMSNGNDLTATYKNYVFHFNQKNQIAITLDYGHRVFTGVWNLTGTHPQQFMIDLDESTVALAPDDLTVFEGTWTVVSFTASSLQLSLGSKQLRFNRT